MLSTTIDIREKPWPDASALTETRFQTDGGIEKEEAEKGADEPNATLTSLETGKLEIVKLSPAARNRV